MMGDIAVLKNRITRHGYAKVADLVKNPDNWRIHPRRQIDVVTDSLRTLGWLDEVLINEPTGHMINGHLRVEIAEAEHDETVPARWADLTAEEEEVALALLDTSGMLATVDQTKLNALLGKARAFFDTAASEQRFQAANALLESLKRDKTSRPSKDGAVTHEGERAMTINEKVAQYENTTVRQVMLHFDVTGYVHVMMRLDWLRAFLGVETNTEAVMHVLDDFFHVHATAEERREYTEVTYADITDVDPSAEDLEL